jgi:ABC-type Fe3+ transport system substrate-binding protein
MSFHAAALFVLWGDARASQFFKSLQANCVVLGAGNSDVKDRVAEADGRVAVGIIDEDDAVVALRDMTPVALVVRDQEGANALGTPFIPNAGLLVRGARTPSKAKPSWTSSRPPRPNRSWRRAQRPNTRSVRHEES